jgi:hypothetical protein
MNVILSVLIESALVPKEAVDLLLQQGLLDPQDAARYGQAPLPSDEVGLLRLAGKVEAALAKEVEAESLDDIGHGADVLVHGQFDQHTRLTGKICGQILYVALPTDVEEDALFVGLGSKISIAAWGGHTADVEYRNPEVVQHRGSRWLRVEL